MVQTPEEISKPCSKCKIVQPLSAFDKAKGRPMGSSQCKACRKEYHKLNRTPEKQKDSSLRHNYGITLVEYNDILQAQNGKCWLCKKPCGTGRSLAVDHDHKTGEIRGLLCMRCNKYVVGNQTIETVKMLVSYFENPPARQMWGGIPRFVPEGRKNPPKKRRKRRVSITRNRRKNLG